MSQYPPNTPYDQGYGGVPNYYGGASPNPRPGAVTGVAITGIILGILGIICSGSGVLLNLAALNSGGKNPLAPQLPAMSHNLLAFSVFQCVLNVALALTLLICSIGALGLKPFSRAVLMPWSVISIIWAIVICVVQIMWMGPETRKLTQGMVAGNSAAFQTGQEIGQTVGAVLFSALMCVIPILILTLWNKPHVKAAFGISDGLAPLPPQQFPPNYPPTYPQP